MTEFRDNNDASGSVREIYSSSRSLIVKENPLPDSLLILNQTAIHWVLRLNC